MGQQATGMQRTAAAPKIARELGKMERSAWIFDQASPFNLGSSVDLHGSVTEAGLRKALRWCQARHPLLRSVVRMERNRPHFACFAPEDAPEIPLETAMGRAEDRDRIGTDELRRPFNGQRELMIRMKLVTFAAGHFCVFVTFQHLIGDGFSAANLLVDVVNLLGKACAGEALPPAEPLPFPPALEDGISPRFLGLRGLMRMVGCQSKVTRKMKELGDMPAPLRNDASVPFEKRLPVIETIAFNEAETAALLEQARQEKVTLYALLVAITLEAIHPVLAESPKNKDTKDRVITMPVPANLRPFLTTSEGTDFGFYASTLDLVFKLTENNDIPRLAKQVRSELKAGMRKDCARLYVMPAIAGIMDWKLFFPNKSAGIARAARFIASMAKHSSTSITFLNFQKLVRKASGLTVTNARGYVAPSMLGTALFSAVLFADVLHVHMSYNETQVKSEDAALLKSRFRETALRVAGFR